MAFFFRYNNHMSVDWENQLLLGRFRVDIRLPGPGEAYRAWDNQTKQVVSLYLLTEAEDEPRREFETGIRDLERAIHPAVLPYFGLFELSGQRFWVEGYLEGPTLRLVLDAAPGTPLPLGEVLTYLKSLSAALEALHQLGWVHGNLRPESVRLGRDGGIQLGELFAARRVVDDFDRMADVSALAKLLYEMLAGNLPYETPLPDLREANPKVPEFLARTLPRALGENPENRIASPNEFFLLACLSSHIDAEKLPVRFVGGAVSPSAALVEGWTYLPPMAPPPVTPRTITERERRGEEQSNLFWWLTAGAIVLAGLAAGSFFAGQIRPSPGQGLPTAAVAVTDAAPVEVLPTPTVEVPLVIPTDTVVPTMDAPDGLGGRIVFTCTRANLMQLCMVLPTGEGGVARLTGETAHDFYPSFSPNGKSILFASNRGGGFDLYLKSLDDDITSQLTSGVGEVSSASFAPDGKIIAFSSYRDDRPSLWTVGSDGQHMLMLYEGQGNIASPVWSPNGKSIAFVMSTAQNAEAYDAYIYDTETKSIAPVTQGHLNNAGGSVDWSPDGRFLLLYAGTSGNHHIYQLELISGQITQLTTEGNNWAGSYSPDGRWIVFNRSSDGVANIFIMRPDGSDVRQLTQDTEEDWQPRWGR